MTKKLQKLRDKDPYSSERTTSYRRFWATFQQDYYATVIIKKPKITHMAQYVDWTYMESKGDPIFTELSTVCGRQRVKELMGFRQDWNKEIIARFLCHGSLWSHRVREGYDLDDKWEQVCHLLFPVSGSFCFGADDKDYPKLHDGGLLEPESLGSEG
jgi:hypothetical protein